MSKEYLPKKIAELEADAVFVDKETGFLKVHNNRFGLAADEKIYYLDIKSGKKSSVFDFASDFSGGLAFAGFRKKGLGFINTDFEFVVEPVYEYVSLFENGIAKVYRDGKYGFINRSGELLFDPQIFTERKYSEIGEYKDGVCMVSAMPVLQRDFVDRNCGFKNPGIWGFIVIRGEETVKPQYVFAEDFCQGTAVVAKGEWIFDSEECVFTCVDVRWGVIDQTGSEVVPFEYSEIRRVSLDGAFFAVCIMDGDEKTWGVADRYGNLLVAPVFNNISEVYQGLVVFSDTAYSEEDDEYNLFGVYDMNSKQIILKPEYCSISIEDNAYFKVKYLKNGRSVESFIDRNGNELFDSVFSFVATWCSPYSVGITDCCPKRYGFIENNGKLLFLSPEERVVDKLNYEKQRAVYCDPETYRRYLCDFEGNELTGHMYTSVTDLEKPLFTVAVWNIGSQKTGLIDCDGKAVVEMVYDSISWIDDSCYIAAAGRKREIFKL